MRNFLRLKKPLLIITAIVIAAAAIITVIRFIDNKKEQKAFEVNNAKPKFSHESYRFGEAGALDPSEVNLSDYIPLKEFGSFFLSDDAEMLRQAMELTYVSVFDYKYFIDNNCYSYDNGGKNHYYFFGSDKTYLPFYLKISENWGVAQWYVLKDYAVPTVNVKKIKSIIIVDALAPTELLSNSLETFDLHRIDTKNAVIIEDEKEIREYLEKYNNKIYVFNDKTEGIAKAKENSDSGYVLASFENSSILQCIGAY